MACDAFWPDYDPTGGEYRRLEVIEGEKCMVVFNPITEETMMAYWVKDGDIWSSDNIGIVLLYDITSQESFMDLERICGRLLALRTTSGDMSSQADKVNQSATDNGITGMLAAIIVGTKSDLESERQVEYAQGRALAAKFGCGFLEVSSRSGSNVAKVLDDLLKVMRQRRARSAQPISNVREGGILRSRGKVGRQCIIV